MRCFEIISIPFRQIIYMKVTLQRKEGLFNLAHTNERGFTITTDASPSIGGGNEGFRPMELLLSSLASCSAIDVINILNKQKQNIHSFSVDVEGERVDGTPSPFKKINVHFNIKGEVDENKLKRAIDLTKDKYCSVRFSLHPDIEINYTFTLTS